MIATLWSFIGGRVGWPLVVTVGAAVLLGGGYLYLRMVQADLEAATLRATLAEAGQAAAVKTAAANAKTITIIRDEAKKTSEGLAAERDAAVARATTTAFIQGEIAHAPLQTLCTPGNDDVVAPVLSHTLDRLRHEPAAARGGD